MIFPFPHEIHHMIPISIWIFPGFFPEIHLDPGNVQDLLLLRFFLAPLDRGRPHRGADPAWRLASHAAEPGHTGAAADGGTAEDVTASKPGGFHMISHDCNMI